MKRMIGITRPPHLQVRSNPSRHYDRLRPQTALRPPLSLNTLWLADGLAAGLNEFGDATPAILIFAENGVAPVLAVGQCELVNPGEMGSTP